MTVTARPVPKKSPARKSAQPRDKLTVLFGSNMGTAEELARTIAETGEIRGSPPRWQASTSAGKLPAEGRRRGRLRVVQWQSARQRRRVRRRARDAAPGSLNGVRYTVFGCGNRDWASTYQAVPRLIDELMAEKGRNGSIRAARGDAKEDLDGHFQTWNEAAIAGVGRQARYQARRRNRPRA